MSRIGNNPVAIPAGVTVKVDNGLISVEGKLGKLTQEFSDVTVKIEGDEVLVTRPSDSKDCLLYTSPSPRDQRGSRMPSSA